MKHTNGCHRSERGDGIGMGEFRDTTCNSLVGTPGLKEIKRGLDWLAVTMSGPGKIARAPRGSGHNKALGTRVTRKRKNAYERTEEKKRAHNPPSDMVKTHIHEEQLPYHTYKFLFRLS